MAKGTPNAGIGGTLANGLLTHLCFNDGSLQDISLNGNDAIKVATPTTDSPSGTYEKSQARNLLLENNNNIEK